MTSEDLEKYKLKYKPYSKTSLVKKDILDLVAEVEHLSQIPNPVETINQLYDDRILLRIRILNLRGTLEDISKTTTHASRLAQLALTKDDEDKIKHL